VDIFADLGPGRMTVANGLRKKCYCLQSGSNLPIIVVVMIVRQLMMILISGGRHQIAITPDAVRNQEKIINLCVLMEG